MATGKRRAAFFTSLELEILIRPYGKFEDVFRNKCNTSAAAKAREMSWENVVVGFSLCFLPGGAPHTITDHVTDDEYEETMSAAFTEGDPEGLYGAIGGSLDFHFND